MTLALTENKITANYNCLYMIHVKVVKCLSIATTQATWHAREDRAHPPCVNFNNNNNNKQYRLDSNNLDCLCAGIDSCKKKNTSVDCMVTNLLSFSAPKKNC